MSSSTERNVLPLHHRISTVARSLPQAPPLLPSLHHLEKLHYPLPLELLSIAQSSSTSSSAVANALGVRAVILTSRVAKSELAKWINALAPFVKAVGFWETRIKTNGQYYVNSVTALNAIASPPVALRALDITDIPLMYADAEQKKSLQYAFTRALATNTDSLTELAVSTSNICEIALLNQSLPSLEVLEVEVGYSEDLSLYVKAIDVLSAFSRATVEPPSAESRLTELRLIHVFEPPCTDRKESECGERFFQQIGTLDMQISSKVQGDQQDEIASFVTLFPHLKCFRWNGVVTTKIMRAIVTSCPELNQLHLCPRRRYFDRDMPYVLAALNIVQGRLQTLRIKATLSQELVRSLGCFNPGLRVLSAEIGPDNVSALTPLLATECRNLRTLHLTFSNVDTSEVQPLGSEGWRVFDLAAQSASSELTEVIVETGNGDDLNPSEPDFYSLVNAIRSVLYTLKDRARVVRFQVPAWVTHYRVIFDALCGLLKVATTNCPNLEELELRITVADVDLMWDDDEEPEKHCRELLQARQMFTDAARKLYYLELDKLDCEAEDELREWGKTV